jgi:phosphatidylglycerol:prolipoprotein diacylglycerol transferase
MLPYPHIDPVIFQLGRLQVRWYGLMYVIGFSASYLLVKKQIVEKDDRQMAHHFDNLNVTLILSLIFGARLGYVLFYNLAYYADHPLEILAIWQGGMSFHGALVGLLVGGFLFCRKMGLNFLKTADLYVVTAPIGLGFGRLGNFINGELYGRVSDVPWAMIFPGGGPLPRHPSQLYECLLEGVLLFLILWPQRKKNYPPGFLLAFFLIAYGLLRFGVEFFSPAIRPEK